MKPLFLIVILFVMACKPGPETAIEATPSQTKEPIILGQYTVANESPINLGDAVVSLKGNGLYHLQVNVSRGLTHHEGYIESDFNVKLGRIILTDKEYSKVNVIFSENKIAIDYPDSEHHGGVNADPKGEYYLKNAESFDNQFMKGLFDSVQLDQPYRDGFTDVYVTSIVDKKQLLLLRSRSSINRQFIVSEKVVLYNEEGREFQYLGEISSYEIKKLTEKLVSLGFDEETIYNTLKKDYKDRYIQTMMNDFDFGKALTEPLTDEEAFYIVTGEEGKTRISDNRRDQDNIGSIFITEVDHSDSKSVTIHVYEAVRNDEEDTHTATSDWITVDRSNGKIKGFFED